MNFTDLKTGDRFSYNGTEYIKVDEVRVSCCKSINCQAAQDPNKRIQIPPNTTVTING